MAAKFKVGDRVRYRDGVVSGVGVIMGVDDVEGFGYDVRVEAKDAEFAYYPEGVGRKFYARNLEPLPVAEATGTDAPKFKVGDRVKFRDDYNSSARGTEATVVNVDSPGIMVDGVHGKSTEQPSSLRLVAEATSGKFKAGDRVRMTESDGCRRTAGSVGVVEELHSTYCRVAFDAPFDGWGSEGRNWHVDYKNLTPIPTLTIQPGKFYRTRDGRKVGPMLIWDKESEWPWSDHFDSGSGVWRGDGSVFDHREDDDDLIAEWVDDPDVIAAMRDVVAEELYGRAPANDNGTAGFTIPLCALEAEPDLTAIGKAYADGYAAGLAARQAA